LIVLREVHICLACRKRPSSSRKSLICNVCRIAICKFRRFPPADLARKATDHAISIRRIVAAKDGYKSLREFE
jgi:hypothetical protein